MFDKAGFLQAIYDKTAEHIDKARKVDASDITKLLRQHMADVANMIAQCRMIPVNLRPTIGAIVASMESHRYNVRKIPDNILLSVGEVSYAISMDANGAIEIVSNMHAQPEKWDNIHHFQGAYHLTPK